MYVIVLPLSSSFLLGTEKVMYYSTFSPEHSNWPSDSSANCLIMKWLSYLEPLWITTGISFDVFYFKLQILWAATLNFPV